MRPIVLTPTEWQIIISALAAVGPSGGGSTIYSLQRKLESVTGLQADNAMAVRMQEQAKKELG